MLARFGVIALVLGLTVSLGQAQEQTSSPDRQADRQDEPSHLFSSPIAIDVIEDEAQAQARKRKEEESRQREIDDLAAQKGMNTATQSIETATRDMRDYALYSTVLVGIGTVLLFYTLWLTRQANKAAQDAVEVTRNLGVAEHRPYLQGNMGPHISHWDEANNEKISWRIKLILSNSGNTPTKNLLVRSCWRIAEGEINTMPATPAPVAAYARGHDKFSPLTINVLGEDLADVKAGRKNLFVFFEAIYGTALSDEARYITRQGFRACNITGDPVKYWDEKNPLGIEWAQIPTFYCFDEECDDN